MGDLVQREHPQKWGGIGVGHSGAQKTAISPKRCKIGPRVLYTSAVDVSYSHTSRARTDADHFQAISSLKALIKLLTFPDIALFVYTPNIIGSRALA